MRAHPRWEARRVPRYLVEAYLADSPAAREGIHEQADRAATLGRGVRHVRTTFLPTDEVALHVFEAPSLDELRRAGECAALHYERIVEAVESSTREEETR